MGVIKIKNITVGTYKVPTHLVLISMAIGSGLVAWYVMKRESLESVGWKVIGCIHRGDGGCMYDYSDSQERQLLGYDRNALVRFGREYLAPAFEGTELSNDKTATALPQQGWVLATRAISGSDVSTGIGVRVARTSDGIKVPTLVGESFLAAAVVKYSDSNLSQPERKIRAWLRAGKEDGPLLREFGIHGIWIDASDRFFTWEEFVNKTEIQLEKTLAIESENRKKTTR